jgi:hypothetical protein
MAYFPIVQKHGRIPVTTLYRKLPEFYMEDFSILGFKVSDCDIAIRILDNHQYPLKQEEEGIEVELNGPSHMHDVLQLLRGNGLECEIADVAEEMYQG